MSDKIVICRRDIGEIGERVYCAKPITTPNGLNWCLECSRRLPIWPALVLALFASFASPGPAQAWNHKFTWIDLEHAGRLKRITCWKSQMGLNAACQDGGRWDDGSRIRWNENTGACFDTSIGELHWTGEACETLIHEMCHLETGPSVEARKMCDEKYP